jgi:hypothetical protein
LGIGLPGVRLGRPDGSPLTLREAFFRLWALCVKCGLVFFLGPLLAIVGGSVGLSWLGLLLPLGLFYYNYLLSLKNPDGAAGFERMGNYRYFRR